jgi:hypothetical protein
MFMFARCKAAQNAKRVAHLRALCIQEQQVEGMRPNAKESAHIGPSAARLALIDAPHIRHILRTYTPCTEDRVHTPFEVPSGRNQPSV